MKWLLILAVINGGVATVPFKTERTCAKAAEKINTDQPRYIRAYCVEVEG